MPEKHRVDHQNSSAGNSRREILYGTDEKFFVVTAQLDCVSPLDPDTRSLQHSPQLSSSRTAELMSTSASGITDMNGEGLSRLYLHL